MSNSTVTPEKTTHPSDTPAPNSDNFLNRHLGPNSTDIQQMLQILGLQTLDELIDKTVPRPWYIDWIKKQVYSQVDPRVIP
ncbi:MAG: hypothetical protein HGA42_17935, partial [Nostocales cyanobacterium W4_Combined_metabat2_030]|nr:hypothetical protein [Nostocales cyanobacterium W4_Combined_metabat2_030]